MSLLLLLPLLQLLLLNEVGLAAGDTSLYYRFNVCDGKETPIHRMFAEVLPNLEELLGPVQSNCDGRPATCDAIRQAVCAAPVEKVAGALLRNLLRHLFAFTTSGQPGWARQATRAVEILSTIGITVNLDAMPEYAETPLSADLLAIIEGDKPLPTDQLEPVEAVAP